MNTPTPTSPPDDLHLIVLLWQDKRNRELALALADRNASAARKERA